MSHIRPAGPDDLGRIAEIETFNYRLNFYPLFKSDWFYFQELQVTRRMEHYREHLGELYVYDDGIIKGFFHLRGEELVASGTEGVHGLTLSNAMHLSAWTGREVEVPFDDDLFYDLLMERVKTSRRKENVQTVISDLSATYNTQA